MTPLDMDCQSDGCLFATNKKGMRTQGGRCTCMERPGARIRLGRFINEARALEKSVGAARAEGAAAERARLVAVVRAMREHWGDQLPARLVLEAMGAAEGSEGA